MNLKDIFQSWTTMANPSELEYKRGKDRFNVCSSCEFKKELIKNKEWTIFCDSCGCPIQTKIYSSVTNPCPKNKWEDVDKKYKQISLIKNNKSLF